jgi:hypothetical protein
MDIGSPLTTALINQSMSATNQAIGIAVMNKAMNSQVAGAATMIASLPKISQPNLPAHLGQNINTTA